jgi:NAD(P)-dependent dehydrogenase (short-subunit alcohol dehydrogenase family)
MDCYKDKVVVITGSATGIGFSLAKQFAGDGARVVISGLPGDDISGAIEKLRAQGIATVGLPCDVTQRGDVEQLAAFVLETFGQVDVLVNNAGVAQLPAPIIEMDLEAFRRVYEVNIYGVLNCIQVFGKRLIEQGTPAAIYNLGSENSLYPCVPSSHAYVSSKHAILAITEMLKEEVPENIEVALILPGLVKSEMTRELGLGMETDEFAETVFKQLKAGAFYAVSHPYNKVRMTERFENIGAAFDQYAPRYEGDQEHDIRTMLASMGLVEKHHVQHSGILPKRRT